MAGRTYAVWNKRDDAVYYGNCRGYDYFMERNALGENVVGYALYGNLNGTKTDDVRHAFVWQKWESTGIHGVPTRPPQKMSKRPLGTLDFQSELTEMRQKQFSPAYIGAFGTIANPRFSAIYEQTPAGTRPEMVLGPRWWSPAEGVGFVDRLHTRGAQLRMYARSAVLYGEPTAADFGFGGERGLRFAATLWPLPAEGFGWAVHLTPNQINMYPGSTLIDTQEFPPGPWRKRWETRALGIQAYPVAGMTSTTIPNHGSLTLTLWHDVRYMPWPTPKSGDPFSAWETFRVIDAEESNLEGDLETWRTNADCRPLSIGASLDVNNKAYFFVPLGRPGTEAPLPRTYCRRRKVGGQEFAPAPEHYALRGGLLDQWVMNKMIDTGARHAQLVVVRRGWLAHATAYTRAEEGYPVATLENALRIASVSKILTAILAWAKVMPQLPGGLLDAVRTPIARNDLLGTTAPPPPLDKVQLAQLLTHNSGLALDVWGSDPILNTVLGPAGNQGEVAKRTAYGVVEPGMITDYLLKATGVEFFDADPGASCNFVYNNQGYILLGECMSRFFTEKSSRYADVVRERMLAEVGVTAANEPLYARGWTRARQRNESPGQCPRPSTAWNRFEPDNETFPITSGIYARDGVFEAAAGGWCVPLLWVARVLARLVSRRANPAYLSRAGLEAMATLIDPTCPDTKTAYGCVREPGKPVSGDPFQYKFNQSRGQPDPDPSDLGPEVVRIHHNGMTSGGGAFLMHQFPLDPSDSRNRTADAVSICVAFNTQGTQGLGEGDGFALLDILQKMEWEPPISAFPDHDLFDDL